MLLCNLIRSYKTRSPHDRRITHSLQTWSFDEINVHLTAESNGGGGHKFELQVRPPRVMRSRVLVRQETHMHGLSAAIFSHGRQTESMMHQTEFIYMSPTSA